MGFQKRSAQPIILIWLALAFLTGCGSHGLIRVTNKTSRLRDKVSAPVVLPQKPVLSVKLNIKHEINNKGSLWNQNQSRSFYFQDAKASRVGDIVTVRVVENAKGTKGANTKTKRSSGLTASTAAFFGTSSDTLANIGADTTFSNSFDGDGSTTRSGSLTAEVTAVVRAVYPNGNMMIEGQREVLINNEKEYLSVSGLIRPEDVQQGNTVLSTVIADAKIEYSGSGVVSDKQRPGWAGRLLDFIWPF